MQTKRNNPLVKIPNTEIRLTEKELCEFWHIKPETLRRWRKSGNGTGLRYIKIGGRVIYDMADIKQFENARKFISADQKVDIETKGAVNEK